MGSSKSTVSEKEGIVEIESDEGVTIYVKGSRYIARVASALASETRTKILELLIEGPRDLDDLATELKQSKANISNQIKRLEEIGFVSSYYKAGDRGVRKLVNLRARKIVFEI
ncbi:MAG: ArsR family transcriptional regulator [Acidilobaceae archaeon]